jgi:hypothetical protein
MGNKQLKVYLTYELRSRPIKAHCDEKLFSETEKQQVAQWDIKLRTKRFMLVFKTKNNGKLEKIAWTDPSDSRNCIALDGNKMYIVRECTHERQKKPMQFMSPYLLDTIYVFKYGITTYCVTRYYTSLLSEYISKPTNQVSIPTLLDITRQICEAKHIYKQHSNQVVYLGTLYIVSTFANRVNILLDPFTSWNNVAPPEIYDIIPKWSRTDVSFDQGFDPWLLGIFLYESISGKKAIVRPHLEEYLKLLVRIDKELFVSWSKCSSNTT